MRLIISVVAILAICSPTPVFAQVKQWVDEKGTVHYEATGPGQPKTINPSQPKPNARRPLERNHAGLTLGDNEASFTAAKKGDYPPRSVLMETTIDIPERCPRERSTWEIFSSPVDWH